MLSSLLDITHEASSDRRRELLTQISALFVEGADDYSDREVVLFSDIMTRLIEQVPVEDRVALSERVAHVERTPHEVALRLTNDSEEVAAPILEHSTVLTDGDLVKLAQEKGQGHLLAISRRSLLSELITDVIVERGDDAVLTSVARNAGARFSEGGYNAMGAKASLIAGLGDILADRSDLPAAVAKSILPTLSAPALAKLSQLQFSAPESVQTLFSKARDEYESMKGAYRRERMEGRLLAADIREKKRSLDDVVAQLIYEKRLSDIAYILSEFAGVPISQVANAMHKTDSTVIALTCRVLGVSEGVYERLATFRCEKLKMPMSEVKVMVSDYLAVDKSVAERALRFHKIRVSVQR